MPKLQAPTYNPTAIKTIAASTTGTYDDDYVKVNGTYTYTLPAISTMHANGAGAKTYKIENIGSGIATVASNSADTINGGTTHALNSQNDYIIIEADRYSATGNWKITYPDPIIETVNIKDANVTAVKVLDSSLTGAKLTADKGYYSVTVATSGTTPQNVFGAGGAPTALTITGVKATAKDVNAGNMVLKNGTNTVASFAKSTTAGIVTGEDGALANTAVAAAAVCTVESSTTNGNGYVEVCFTVA
jgi:hypothetical protein